MENFKTFLNIRIQLPKSLFTVKFLLIAILLLAACSGTSNEANTNDNAPPNNTSEEQQNGVDTQDVSEDEDTSAQDESQNSDTENAADNNTASDTDEDANAIDNTEDDADTSAVDETTSESIGDAEHGRVLFHEVAEGAPLACATCHNTDSEERLVGPGLLNIGTRAATRVEGQSAIEYIRTSIIDPNAYIVEGFGNPSPMPTGFGDAFTEEDLNDLIAYLLTLEG
ncbi:MAG: hypothetical protein CUN54_03085 [Phototrophicales bacterium]|nr:MAG: hypothetical protein CUN54_03085 [Phototrophicales bacterium]